MVTIKAKTIENKELEDKVEISEKGLGTYGEYFTIICFAIDKLKDIQRKETILKNIKAFMEIE
jgi:hypothetical protein